MAARSISYHFTMEELEIHPLLQRVATGRKTLPKFNTRQNQEDWA